MDIILVLSAGTMILFIKSNYRKNKTKEISPLAFIVDEPITEIEEDKLERNKLAKYLATRLKETNSNKSIAIGISGIWGSGKSSFLSLLKKHLDSKDTVIMNFNPWMSLSSRGIVKDFFETLSEELGKYSYQLSKQIDDYSSHLLSVKNDIVTRSINTGIRILQTDDTTKQFNLINKTLEKLNKQVVVCIDDLDRLDKKEIIETIRLVRNTADFNNIKFIVAFDREYVLTAIKELNNYNHYEYLEKIFLQIIELPPLDSSQIKKHLQNLLIERFPDQKSEIINSITGNEIIHRNITKEVVKTIRDVKRFLNYFVADYDVIKGEVLFEDFLSIQLLKFKYPVVYKILYLKSSSILEVNTSGIQLDNKYKLVKEKDANGNDSSITIIEKMLQESYEEYNIPKNEIEVVMKLLFNLFSEDNWPSFTEKNHYLSIESLGNFHKYFFNRLLETDLSENEFKEALSKPIDKLKTIIQSWVNADKKVPVIQRFTRISILELKSNDEFEKLIEAIFFLAKACNKNDNVGIQPNYDDRDLYNKLDNGSNELTNRFYNGDKLKYKRFLKGLLISAEYPFLFESRFIKSVIKENWGGLPISIEELQEIQVEYFKECTNKISGFDNDHVWALYNNCITVKEEVVSATAYKMQRNPKANEAFIDYVEKDNLKEFLRVIITCEPRNKMYKVHDIVQIIFGSYNDFSLYLQNHLSKVKPDDYLEEFINFFEECKKNNFNQHIHFDFDIIPIDKIKT